MMAKVLQLLFIGWICCGMYGNVHAGTYYYHFNERCQSAYKLIMSLQMKEAIQLLEAEKKAAPQNLIPWFLDNYIDFFELFFNEDPAQYQLRLKHRTTRLQKMDMGSAANPYHAFTKAVINFQWAAIRIKFGDRWDAGWEMRRSYLLIKENLQKYPHFAPNQLYYGAMQVGVSTIPDGYKWLTSLLGMRGDMQNGIRSIESFLRSSLPDALLFREEGIFYYCYLQFHVLNNKAGILKYIRDQDLDVEHNHLFNYLTTNLYLNNQQAAAAEATLLKRSAKPGYMSTPVWDLEMGYAKLYQLEPDAPVYLERFIKNFKGKFYVKDVLLKLSWWYYLQGDMPKARDYMARVLTSGSTETEADKQAQRTAQANEFPPAELLKARLYSDGGMHQQAIAVLQGLSSNNYQTTSDQLEFDYRLGRIYDDMGKDSLAIRHYDATITKGSNRKEYFAARAALQAGFIYEQRKDWQQAQKAFQKCLNMKGHDYKNSLDQRAKAGLVRIKPYLK